MAGICITPAKTNGDFAPDYHIPYAREILRHMIISHPTFQTQGIEVLQMLSRFSVTLHANNASQISSAYHFFYEIHAMTGKVNQYIMKQGWPFVLYCFTAADYQNTRFIKSMDSDKSSIIWLDPIMERCFKMTDSLSDQSPHFLISHSFYDRLTEKEQKGFTVCYYVKHICCYAGKISS